MSGTDRLLVDTIFGNMLLATAPYHSGDSLSCYDLLTTSNMEDGLVGIEIDCTTIHNQIQVPEISEPLIKVLTIPLL